MRLLYAAAVLGLVLARCGVSDQPGSVEGRVTNAVTGDLIPNALVLMACMTVKVPGTECGTKSVRSGPDGTFRFVSVEPGSYFLTGHAERFVDMLGRSPTAIVATGQQVSNVELKFVPESTISGTVKDEEGKSVPGVSIEALRTVHERGQAHLLQVSKTITSNKGEYTLSGLSAGKYYVSARPAEDGADKNLRFYYPSALTVDQTSPLLVAARGRAMREPTLNCGR